MQFQRFFSGDSSNLALQNCIFQSSTMYIFNTDNVNLQRGVEIFGPPFIIKDQQIVNTGKFFAETNFIS